MGGVRRAGCAGQSPTIQRQGSTLQRKVWKNPVSEINEFVMSQWLHHGSWEADMLGGEGDGPPAAGVQRSSFLCNGATCWSSCAISPSPAAGCNRWEIRSRPREAQVLMAHRPDHRGPVLTEGERSWVQLATACWASLPAPLSPGRCCPAPGRQPGTQAGAAVSGADSGSNPVPA